ncbi:MAG: GAF domain-containing protein [Candidatus Hydrogenedentes bacterium]|nr:GAF domain-containing protein [Candidatus Hydrogenedentota bacterium]
MTPRIDERVPWLNEVSPDELRRIVDVLYRVHRFISVITDLDTLLERIMEESKQVAHAEACSLMLFDPDREELYFRVALGESGDQQTLKQEVRLKLNQGIAGVAAATRESINVEDARSDSRFYSQADTMTQFETRSLVAVPLVDRDHLVGVLELLNKVGGGPFTETDVHVMEMFSGLVATVIANARLIDENLRAARLAAVGQAVAGLSHYTKNIIAGVGGSVDLISEGLKRDNIEHLQRSWPILKRSMRRISNLVEDMLAYSKARKPARRACDLREIVADVSDTFWGLTVHKRITLDVDVDAVTRPICVDPDGLFRCLLNLLTNAADAVADGTGTIRIAARFNAENQLEIDVADNGPGVPEGDEERIFDLFYSTKGSRGTGLGLAVMRKIVVEHGGDVAVMRNPGGGALFRMRLPVPTSEE